MNFVKKIIKILHHYKVLESQSKKIIKYGSLLSLELLILAVGFNILSYVKSVSSYVDISEILLRNSFSIFIEVVIGAFVFEMLFKK